MTDAGEIPALPSRTCARCRQQFDGDPSLHPDAVVEWWACPACRVSLGIDRAAPC